MEQNAEISLVQNDPPLIIKQSLLIIGQKPYLRQTRGGEGGKNEKIQITVVQHPEISIYCGCNRFFFNSERGVLKNRRSIGRGKIGQKRKASKKSSPSERNKK